MPSLRTLFGAFLLLPAPGAEAQQAAPERPQLQLLETASQEGFPLERPFLDRGSHPLQAAGVYLRVRNGAKLYALCLYVDIPLLVVLTRGKPRTPESLAALLVGGKVPHAFISRFVQPLPRANRMDFLLGNLRTYWPSGGFDPRASGLRPFLGFFDREVAKGTETQVWMDGRGTAYAAEAGGRPVRAKDPKLCMAFTASYLGEKPMDPALRDDLLRELPAVMEMDELLGSQVLSPKEKKGP